MEENPGSRRKFHIGKRVLKTSLAVLCCFFIYALRGHQGIPFNCAVAAIICMQSDIGRSWRAALNRMIGTTIGLFYGMAVVILSYYVELNEYWFYIIVAIVVIMVLETAVYLKQSQVADFACMTFLSIAVIQTTGEALYVDVFNRVLDTVIGIAVAITINSIELPKKKRRDVLFVANLDETLGGRNGAISPYSIVVLNSLIKDGIKFSIFTKGTPATLINFKENIQTNLPAIVMDGCALYDLTNNKYVMKIFLSRDAVADITEIAESMDMVCCYSTVMQDVLLIYFDHFPHMAMQEIYRQLRKSPYRNYICGPLPEEMKDHVIYIKILDERDKIMELADRLKSHPVFDQLRIKTQEVEVAGFSDYLYLHVTDKKASRANASEHLRHMTETKEVISFGSRKWAYDVAIKGDDSNEVVKKIRHMYEVNLWERT